MISEMNREVIWTVAKFLVVILFIIGIMMAATGQFEGPYSPTADLSSALALATQDAASVKLTQTATNMPPMTIASKMWHCEPESVEGGHNIRCGEGLPAVPGAIGYDAHFPLNSPKEFFVDIDTIMNSCWTVIYADVVTRESTAEFLCINYETEGHIGFRIPLGKYFNVSEATATAEAQIVATAVHGTIEAVLTLTPDN